MYITCIPRASRILEPKDSYNDNNSTICTSDMPANLFYVRTCMPISKHNHGVVYQRIPSNKVFQHTHVWYNIVYVYIYIFIYLFNSVCFSRTPCLEETFPKKCSQENLFKLIIWTRQVWQKPVAEMRWLNNLLIILSANWLCVLCFRIKVLCSERMIHRER